ncbi:hypothetical protein [Sulfurimonas sp. HSL-1716]
MLKVSVLLFTLSALLFTGCVNRRGISAKYYNDCNEYYDSKGYYHKDCDKNIIEYEDVKKIFKKKEEKPTGNVW